MKIKYRYNGYFMYQRSLRNTLQNQTDHCIGTIAEQHHKIRI